MKMGAFLKNLLFYYSLRFNSNCVASECKSLHKRAFFCVYVDYSLFLGLFGLLCRLLKDTYGARLSCSRWFALQAGFASDAPCFRVFLTQSFEPRRITYEGLALAPAFCRAVCGPPRCKRIPAGAFGYRSVRAPNA